MVDEYYDPTARVDPEAIYFEEHTTLARELDKLARTAQIAAEVKLDLQDKAALYRYLNERRAVGVEAMSALIHIDPRDGVAIASLQGIIRSWLDACEFIFAKLTEGEQADRQITEEFGENAENGRDARYDD